jgi:hypothetical protein
MKTEHQYQAKRRQNGPSLPAEDVSYLKADILGIGGRRHAGNCSDVARRKPCRLEAYSTYVGGRKAQRRAAGALAKQEGGGNFSSRPLAGRMRKNYEMILTIPLRECLRVFVLTIGASE